MPRGFWDEAPIYCVVGMLKVISGGGLIRGSVVLNGLMGGWMGGMDVPDGLF